MERERTVFEKHLQNTSCVAKLSARLKTSNSSLSYYIPDFSFDYKGSFYSQEQLSILFQKMTVQILVGGKVKMVSDDLLLPQKIWIKLLNPIKSV